MSDSASIFLTGEILTGFAKDDVIADLARLLNTDENKASSLLGGRETLIKRNAAPVEVERYMHALRKAGVAARSEQASAPSAFPTLNVDVVVPRSERVAPAVTSAPQPQPQPMPELALAPGWKKPGEEEAAAEPDARPEPVAGMGFSPTAGVPQAMRRETARAAPVASREPEYGKVPVFGLSADGRIGRLRYMAYFWPTTALVVVAAILVAVILPLLGSRPGMGTVLLAIPFLIVVLWMSLRVWALRLHDLNRSGKWALLPIFMSVAAAVSGSPRMALAGTATLWILTIVLMVWPGSSDDNEYGLPPPPNTEWVQIGAALFVAFWLFGIFGAVQSDRYVNSEVFRASSKASKASAKKAQTEAFLQNYAQQMNAQTPVMMGQSLQLDKVEYTKGVLRYQTTIQGRGVMISDDEVDALKKSMLKSYCSDSQGSKFFPSNEVPVDFVFRYQVTAWDFDSITLKLRPESC